MALDGGPAAKATQSFTNAQVVGLRVQGGDYAVPINRVQEIVRVPAITRVPQAQPGVEVVINLRGRVLPVVDLTARLALGVTKRARSARDVVVDGRTESIGLLVDGVSDVLRVSASDVEPPSATTTGNRPTVVLGVAKLGDRSGFTTSPRAGTLSSSRRGGWWTVYGKHRVAGTRRIEDGACKYHRCGAAVSNDHRHWPNVGRPGLPKLGARLDCCSISTPRSLARRWTSNRRRDRTRA
jgi:purine-binding chemotaxis protein CheW